MDYFKDNNNDLYAFESDGSQDELIKADMVKITAEEMKRLQKIKEETEFNALSYAEKRQYEYPSIFNYIDGLVKGDQQQID
ncbi:hypothetical protein, partial [Curvivirga aplysinae]|uniref:hypothetical protein n=1 Tax=Curvivirga aplysinae TaxID=2529852 RepID=UPI001C3F69FE